MFVDQGSDVVPEKELIKETLTARERGDGVEDPCFTSKNSTDGTACKHSHPRKIVKCSTPL